MATEFPESFKDPVYASLDAKTEKKLGLPVGLLSSIREKGEQTNHSRTNELKTFGVYQFVPATRKAILAKYGLDVTLSPENASEGAGLLLKEGLDRNKGDASQAVGEYVGGLDRKAWGKVTNAYINRVMSGQQASKANALDNGFAKFMAANPATPAAKPEAPVDQKTDALSAGFGSWLSAQQAAPASIPGAEEYDSRAPAPDPTIGEQLVGAGETALALGTGATGGAVGAVNGFVGGLADPNVTNLQQLSQATAQGAESLTYAPRTEAGQAQTQAAGQFLSNTIPLAGMAPQMTALSRAGQVATPAAQALPQVARNTVATAAQNVAATARAIPERVGQMVGREPAAPTPGTLAGVGATGVDMATQRRMAAQDLPVPIELTRGQATRDFAQQRFEGETAKAPEAGAPLRERFAEQNQQVLRNMDAYFDSTGAEAPDLRTAGLKVDEALRKQAARDKVEIRTAYKNAEKAGEMETPVSLESVVNHLNESAPDAATAPLLDVARKRAISTGVAIEGPDGVLVAQPVPLRAAETYRQAINRATDFEPTNIRQSSIIKGLIDEQTEGAGGQLYKEARAKRKRFAENYENRALINDILNNKRGTEDRRVAFEDVFQRSILNGSLDDARNLRRVLHRSGEEGQQAWKELQGQTVNYIRDQATRNVARNERGDAIVSAAGMDKTVKALDSDGKLDFVFGKRGAEQIRTINDVANHIKTVAPGSVNTSNTASVLLAALDMGISGAGGMPLPVMSGLRLVANNVKDRRLRMRVAEALGDAKRKEAAKPKPIQGVTKKTIH